LEWKYTQGGFRVQLIRSCYKSLIMHTNTPYINGNAPSPETQRIHPETFAPVSWDEIMIICYQNLIKIQSTKFWSCRPLLAIF